MSSVSPVDLVFMFVERINRQDLEGLVDLMSVDHTFISLDGTIDYDNRLEAEKAWREYFENFPEYMVHLCEAYPSMGGAAVVGRTTGSHLQLPRMEEFPPTLIWAAKIGEDQIKEWRIFRDSPDARAYLGIPPAGGAY